MAFSSSGALSVADILGTNKLHAHYPFTDNVIVPRYEVKVLERRYSRSYSCHRLDQLFYYGACSE